MGYNDTFGIKMLGGTLLVWGSEAQKHYYLPRILSGEDRWCQGFSEPGSGSDLSSLTTKAVLDGDHWVITGQKLWTSRAIEANHIFMLARTDPQAPKNRGITFLLVDLEQPGIEIRPIKALSGESEFNEVFFSGAVTPADHAVGPVHDGWTVASTLLGLERGEEAATNPILFRAELDRLLALAHSRGVAENPMIRQELADLYARCEVMRFLGLRILTGVLSSGKMGPEASVSKLYWSEYHQRATNTALRILGASAMVSEGRGPLRAYRTDDPGSLNTTGSWIGTLYNSVAGTIYAGTSEIQRNIIGESVLGLPREPRLPGTQGGQPMSPRTA
jgi:alkylation response protein AidB-like acyl-CoA dehydrogenase